MVFGFGGARQEYDGTKSFRYVEPLITDAKELCIISPFIDGYYARFIRHRSRARRIYIISSSISPGALSILKAKSSRAPLGIAAMLIISELLLASYAQLNAYLLVASSAMALFLLLLYLLKRSTEPIRVKRPHGFYHMKIYVSDRAAVKGSANLTYAGMHKNHESVSIFRDSAGINDVKKEFWRIWNSG